uniref:EF-hand domain-containing protein n=1 Tax=Haptolina brevifila TaxID=156173 RepID=A0A7S2JHC6_9EUKA|mmetsp:Transcript_82525/g.164535  ORF Transcript_82525/g.164535 Transcript_82525/m.164535 type:complete len:500 (+) Transcript_82525:100-1599(+)
MGKKKDTRTRAERMAAREEFAIAMRQTAMEYDTASREEGGELSFKVFSQMMREREVGIHSEVALQGRFAEMDKDGGGTIDCSEFIRFALRDALMRSAANLTDIFEEWDEDGNGHIDRDEFKTALRSYGFVADDELLMVIFDELAKGTVDTEVLVLEDVANRFVRELEKRKRPLQRLRTLKDRSATIAEPSSEPTAPIAIDPRRPLGDQIREMLRKQNMRVMDLFRSWDLNGDGLIQKKEFRQAINALGFEIPTDPKPAAAYKAAVDEVFNELDADGGGTLDYHELSTMLAAKIRPAASSEPQREVVHLGSTSKAAVRQHTSMLAAALKTENATTTIMDPAGEGLRLPPIDQSFSARQKGIKRQPRQRVICRPPPVKPVGQTRGADPSNELPRLPGSSPKSFKDAHKLKDSHPSSPHHAMSKPHPSITNNGDSNYYVDHSAAAGGELESNLRRAYVAPQSIARPPLRARPLLTTGAEAEARWYRSMTPRADVLGHSRAVY